MTDKETIAALRRFFDAFNRGDFEAVVQLVHPNVEFVRTGGMSSIKGIAALREWMEPDAFEEQRRPTARSRARKRARGWLRCLGSGSWTGVPLLVRSSPAQ